MLDVAEIVGVMLDVSDPLGVLELVSLDDGERPDVGELDDVAELLGVLLDVAEIVGVMLDVSDPLGVLELVAVELNV